MVVYYNSSKKIKFKEKEDVPLNCKQAMLDCIATCRAFEKVIDTKVQDLNTDFVAISRSVRAIPKGYFGYWRCSSG